MVKDKTISELEKTLEEESHVKGHLAKLDDTRLVFLGRNEAEGDEYYMGFRSSEGNDTKIKLSKEAMDSLVDLYNRKQKGDEMFPFTWKLVYEVRVEGEDVN